MNVVHIPVLVVIDPIARNLTGICPNVGGEVPMRVADTGVDHRHHHGVRPGCDIPSLHHIDVGTSGPPVLTRVLESPEGPIAEAEVIGSCVRRHHEIRLHILEEAAGFEILDALHHPAETHVRCQDRRRGQPALGLVQTQQTGNEGILLPYVQADRRDLGKRSGADARSGPDGILLVFGENPRGMGLVARDHDGVGTLFRA